MVNFTALNAKKNEKITSNREMFATNLLKEREN